MQHTCDERSCFATVRTRMCLIWFGGRLSKGEYDARLMADTPKRRARRRFADEFKVGVVRLVLDDGMTVGGVTRAMDLAVTAARELVTRVCRIARTSPLRRCNRLISLTRAGSTAPLRC